MRQPFTICFERHGKQDLQSGMEYHQEEKPEEQNCVFMQDMSRRTQWLFSGVARGGSICLRPALGSRGSGVQYVGEGMHKHIPHKEFSFWQGYMQWHVQQPCGEVGIV